MLVDDVISAMCLGGSGGCGVPGSGGRGGGQWGGDSSRSLSKPRHPPGDLFGLLPSGPGSLRSLAAAPPPPPSCADASTRERKSSSGAPPTNPPSPSGPQKKYTFLVMTKYFRIFESKFLLSFLKETSVLLT
uniref:Uncharacterized protein n=1 Tax=Myotis myotis TaxID=51298 RepID=A0A7J7WHL4_MYOMY|nr:hypothetical protein mMyoMyo1_012107 [Myotis myotis]